MSLRKSPHNDQKWFLGSDLPAWSLAPPKLRMCRSPSSRPPRPAGPQSRSRSGRAAFPQGPRGARSWSERGAAVGLQVVSKPRAGSFHRWGRPERLTGARGRCPGVWPPCWRGREEEERLPRAPRVSPKGGDGVVAASGRTGPRPRSRSLTRSPGSRPRSGPRARWASQPQLREESSRVWSAHPGGRQNSGLRK